MHAGSWWTEESRGPWGALRHVKQGPQLLSAAWRWPGPGGRAVFIIPALPSFCPCVTPFFLKAQVGQRPHKNILRGCLLQVLPLGNAPHPGAQESVWQLSFTSFGVSSDFSQEHGSQHCLPHLLSSQWVTDINVCLGLYMFHFKGHTYPVCLKLQPYVQRFIWQADP